MRDAAAGDSGTAAVAAAPEPSAAMQRAAELTQRRVNLEQKLRDIDHMVRCIVRNMSSFNRMARPITTASGACWHQALQNVFVNLHASRVIQS